MASTAGEKREAKELRARAIYEEDAEAEKEVDYLHELLETEDDNQGFGEHLKMKVVWPANRIRVKALIERKRQQQAAHAHHHERTQEDDVAHSLWSLWQADEPASSGISSIRIFASAGQDNNDSWMARRSPTNASTSQRRRPPRPEIRQLR